MVHEENKKANMWAMFCHLSALSIYIGIPLGNIIAPLVIWLIRRDEFPFVDEQGKEAVNFQISMIGFVLLPALLVANIILIIIATVKTNKGEGYRYPWTIRFIK